MAPESPIKLGRIENGFRTPCDQTTAIHPFNAWHALGTERVAGWPVCPLGHSFQSALSNLVLSLIQAVHLFIQHGSGAALQIVVLAGKIELELLN